MKQKYVATFFLHLLLLLSFTLSGCGNEAKNGGGNALSELSKFDVDEGLLAIHMRKNNVKKDDRRYARVARSYVERNALAQTIATQESGVPESVLYEVKSRMDGALVKSYLDNYVEESVTPEIVQSFYQDNVNDYSNKKVLAAHIFISTSGDKQSGRNEKYKKAVELAKKARGGDEFSVLVKKYSDDDKTSKKGGELGWLSSDQAENELFVNALLAMSKGDISEPIETPDGFHVLKLLDAPVIEKKPFDEVKAEIEYKLKYEARVKEVEKLKKISEKKVMEDMSRLGIEY